MVARQYDVNTNLVFTWRKLYGDVTADAPGPQLGPVMVRPEQPVGSPPESSTDTIEIELSRGYRVRVGCGVKAATLRLVLDALERR